MVSKQLMQMLQAAERRRDEPPKQGRCGAWPDCSHGGEPRPVDGNQWHRECAVRGQAVSACRCKSCKLRNKEPRPPRKAGNGNGQPYSLVVVASGKIGANHIETLGVYHSCMSTRGKMVIWDRDTEWPGAGMLHQFALNMQQVQLVRDEWLPSNLGMGGDENPIRAIARLQGQDGQQVFHVDLDDVVPTPEQLDSLQAMLNTTRTEGVFRLRIGDELPAEPADPEPALPAEPPKVVIETGVGIGDALIATGAIRSLAKAYPGIDIRVFTNAPEVFHNNPYVNAVYPKNDGSGMKQYFKSNRWKFFHATGTRGYSVPNYGVMLRSSRDASHRTHTWTDWGNDPDAVLGNAVLFTCRIASKVLGLPLRYLDMWPSVFLKGNELERPIEQDYWVLCSGAKFSKNPREELVTDVVKRTADLHWVQMGHDGGWGAIKHAAIPQVARDMRNMATTVRDMIRWVYHAKGVLCPEGGWMHIAGATGTPCVVLAGGRPTPGFLDYPGQAFFSAVGSMPCCENFGCWVKDCKFERKCYLNIDAAQVAETIYLYNEAPWRPLGLAVDERQATAKEATCNG